MYILLHTFISIGVSLLDCVKILFPNNILASDLACSFDYWLGLIITLAFANPLFHLDISQCLWAIEMVKNAHDWSQVMNTYACAKLPNLKGGGHLNMKLFFKICNKCYSIHTFKTGIKQVI